MTRLSLISHVIVGLGGRVCSYLDKLLNRRIWYALNNKVLKLTFTFLCLCCCLLISYRFLVTPPPTDLMDSMGAAKQNANPLNFSSWASNRGFGYRTFLQLIHYFSGRANSHVIDIQYQFYLKLIFFLLVLIFIYLCSLLLKSTKTKNSKVENRILFMTIFAILFSVSNSWVSMQPDYLAALMGILTICLVMKQSTTAFFTAGFMIAPVFSLKGVTVLTGFSALVISLLFVKKQNLVVAVKFILTGLISGSGAIFGYLLTHPLDLKDLTDASVFQGTFLDFDFMNRFWVSIWCIFKYWNHVPVIVFIPILILTIIIKSKFYTSDFIFKSSLILSSAALGYLQIFIQGSGYGYNLAAFIPLTFALIVHCAQQEMADSRWFLYTIILSCTVCASNLVPKYMWNNLVSDSEYSIAIEDKYRNFGELNSIINRECDGKLLYLDDGLSAYFLPTPSLSRYTHPIQLYRTFTNTKFLNLRDNYLRYISKNDFQCALIDPALFEVPSNSAFQPLLQKFTRDFKQISEVDGVTLLYKLRSN